jgi:uncharacterized protein
MKSDKSSLKKAVKKVTESIRERSSAVAAKLKKEKPASAITKATEIAGKKPAPAKVTAGTEPAEAPATAKSKRKAPVKSAARKETPAVPAILLEGDQPSAPTVGGPGQRYALGPVPPVEHAGRVESPGELPEAYGTRKLLLAARDPHWLYARWDLTREQQREYNALSVDRHLVIRIFVDKVGREPAYQVHVHPESNHWFVPVALAGTKYIAELGYYKAGGKWTAISTSGTTLTPPDGMAEDTSAQFATIPIDVPFARLMELARLAVLENIPLAEVLRQLRASGYHIPPSTEGEWSPEQERALGTIITMDRVRRVWIGSLEITELIRRKMQQELSSMAAAQFSLPTSPGGAITSVSSPFGGAERKKGFWFNVNAELIIYGATEPDAQVTIGGREIKLRLDGTFSFRFALPDGSYELPAMAVSADKTDGRSAELKFSRNTRYRGEVGAHPQDPQLKAPLADNVA